MAGPIERSLTNALSNNSRTLSVDEDNNSTPNNSTNTSHCPQSLTQPLITVPQSRKRHHVNTLRQRYVVVKWMIEEVDRTTSDCIISRAANHFDHLLSGDQKAKLQKISRWWKSRDTIMSLKQNKKRLKTISASTRRGTNRIYFKALSGRGRNRAIWVVALYSDLLSDLERLRSAGVKFSASVLRTHALKLINQAPVQSPYHRSVKSNGKLITDRVTLRWVQHFMKRHDIVVRHQTGKLQLSKEKEEMIEKEVAYHVGTLQRGFAVGALKEETIENADETHFVFNMDNGRTLGFKRDKQVKYADVISGGDPITMMVRLTGGRDAAIQPPMLIFKNESSNYPIRNVPDSVPGVCYRTGPKGWMDKRVFKEWLSEPRAIKPLCIARQRVLYVDNCSSHGTDDATVELTKLRTDLRKFPANATHLVQPADSFVIQKLKDAWRKRWDKYKYDCIEKGEWHNGVNGSGSGKLPNPGKLFFLKLAAAAVHDVNSQRDKNGLTYARKAMIRTGMSLNVNGLWEESQLTDELQQIIAKHREYFEGKPIAAADVETETEEDE